MEKTDAKIDNLEKKIDRLENKIDSLASLFEGFAKNAMNKFSEVDERFGNLESEIKEVRQDIRRTELNLIDKLASNKRVDEIETRVKVLESQVL